MQSACIGNPSAHHVGVALFARDAARSAATTSSPASTVDQMPKQVSAGLMFGTALSVPVPDVDRTDYLMILGANPLVSNGSLMTAPDAKGRIRAIRARGGRWSCSTRGARTAEESDEHLFIRPGMDALFPFGVVHVLLEEKLANPGKLAPLLDGLQRVTELARSVPASASPTRAASTPRRSAVWRASSPVRRPRRSTRGIGTCTQEFGTTASWLVDVINVLTGSPTARAVRCSPKGAVGAANAMGAPGRGRGVKLGRFQSRVRGAPEVFGELPVVCLAERSRRRRRSDQALITVAGNPALSTPNGGRLTRALATLEFMVSVDIYLNRNHAPRARHLRRAVAARSRVTSVRVHAAVRNFARYCARRSRSRGTDARVADHTAPAGIVAGQGPDASIDALDDFVFEQQLEKAIGSEHSPAYGRSADDVRQAVAGRRGPERSARSHAAHRSVR